MTILPKSIVNKDILRLVLAFFVIELLSLISFKVSLLSGTFFVLVAVLVLLFTLYKLEYGLWIALAELMIGSQGYLFYLDLPGFRVSIRLAIFLIVFFVWFIKFIIIPHFSGRAYPLKWGISLIKKDRLVQTFLVFLTFIALGVVNGLVHGNGLKNVFFDVNGYLYFGLFFVFLEVFKGKRQLDNFIKIFLGALTYVSLKIFLTLYIFSHSIPYVADYFYHWIRDTRVGEITYAGANFFRIFFQSQIWSLIGVFVIVFILISIINRRSDLPQRGKQIASSGEKGRFIRLIILLIAIETSILISFSRSFWLGGVVGMIVLWVYLIFIAKLNLKKLALSLGLILGSAVLSLVLLFSITNFPLPKPSAEFSAQLLGGRLLSFYGEAGASSRWNQLPVLLTNIKESPLIGTGFGTQVTYQSEDPRIKNNDNPEGWYSTYTFEWGYLDTIIEMGIVGLLIYIFLIGQILYSGWKQRENFIKVGFLIGIIVLLTTHMFSPYLNHPLGISYLMLSMAIFKVDL